MLLENKQTTSRQKQERDQKKNNARHNITFRKQKFEQPNPKNCGISSAREELADLSHYALPVVFCFLIMLYLSCC